MKDYMMALHQRFCKEPECREVRSRFGKSNGTSINHWTGEDKSSC